MGAGEGGYEGSASGCASGGSRNYVSDDVIPRCGDGRRMRRSEKKTDDVEC